VAALTLVFLLLGHCAGDFILQSARMANAKTTDQKVLLKHCLLYGGALLLSMIWFGTLRQLLLCFSLVFLTHILIDFGRIHFEKRVSEKQVFGLFLLDQVLHILILFIVANILTGWNQLGNWLDTTVSEKIQDADIFVLSLVLLAYVICLSPAAVFVKKVLMRLRYQTEDMPMEEEKAKDYISGYVIGMLERVCILTLTLLGQYTAISFVIAAKSLARIKQLEDKEFAEKYLVGTLLSLIIALLVGVLVNMSLGRTL